MEESDQTEEQTATSNEEQGTMWGSLRSADVGGADYEQRRSADESARSMNPWMAQQQRLHSARSTATSQLESAGWDVVRKLGEGYSGNCLLATKGGVTAAVKILSDSGVEADLEGMSEIALLKALQAQCHATPRLVAEPFKVGAGLHGQTAIPMQACDSCLGQYSLAECPLAQTLPRQTV